MEIVLHGKNHSPSLATIWVLVLHSSEEWNENQCLIWFFLFYPQAAHDLTVSFCCKTWMPWAVHAGSKNLLELRKHFPMSVSKGAIQTIQDFSLLPQVSATDDKLSHPLVRPQTFHTGMSPGTPWSPRASSTLRVPEQRGVWAPQGIPGLETAYRDQAPRPWVGLVRDIAVPLEIALGLFWLHGFALWKAQQTFPNKQ